MRLNAKDLIIFNYHRSAGGDRRSIIFILRFGDPVIESRPVGTMPFQFSCDFGTDRRSMAIASNLDLDRPSISPSSLTNALGKIILADFPHSEIT